MAAQPINPAYDQPSPSDAEKKRIRDLSRYYCALRQAPASVDDAFTPTENDDQLEGPSLSKDIVLTALVQLGVYRFGCNRAFVSLIDGQNQHIISEATASISLRNSDMHLPDDGIYLGVTTLDLIFGVCPHAVKLFTGHPVPELHNTDNMTANPTRFIVRDFTKEEGFKERPYVTGWPYFRFYAEVPVYSPAGYVLGSFCVVDDKPRQDFVEAEVAALQEISDSIARHLENVRTVHSHARSDRLVQGLTNFVKGRPESAPSSTASLQAGVDRIESLPPLSKQPSAEEPEAAPLNIEALSLASTVTDETSPFPSMQNSSTVTRSTSLSSPPQESATSQPSIDSVAIDKPLKTLLADERHSTEITRPGTPLITVKESVPVSRRVDALFSHASSLLRDSMDLDGVLFLDACRSNYGIGKSVELTDWEPFPTAVNAGFTSRSSNIPPEDNQGAFCKVLGSASTSVAPGPTSNESLLGSVTEAFLQHLITTYPEGEIFDLDGVVPFHKDVRRTPLGRKSRVRPFRNGRQSPASERDALQVTASLLATYFPDAKTVVFLPLWDWNKGHWLAGTLIWSRDSDRPLESEEFHYFKVFGDAIISEVAKAKSFELENSKSDFISSISHELRSPLHGMLASAELLLETALQPDQRDLVKMLETCGLTLLDTMNHLLDFTKINNLMSIDENANPFGDNSTLATVFDLDILLEEVVGALYAGNLHISRYAGDLERQNMKRDWGNLSVVLRVTEQNSWKMRSISGAWRRIIMSIFGNALKYTQTGFIEVSLCKSKKESETSVLEFAHLSITDTGCGMSADFLRNKLFSPFAQEDTLSEGVGLGMSIVQQLVGLMKGTIDVKSEPGIGTQVDVFIPISSVPQSPSLLRTPTSFKTQFCLIGFDGYSDLTEVPTGSLSREAKRRLCIQSFLTQVITQHPDWNVTFAGTPADAVGNVAIIEEATLEQMAADESLQSSNLINFSRLLVLRNGVPPSAVVKLTNISADVVHTIHPPFCPRKMLDALKWTLETESAPRPPKKSSLTTVDTPSTCSIAKSVAEADFTKVSPIQSRPLIPTLDVVTPVIERESFIDINSTLHVLIVDDNDINLKVLSTFVRKLGHTYETASNGLIALNKYKETTMPFNLVLMDISMPVMDGLVATSQIRAFEKQQSLAPVTILAVTGVASATMQQQAVAAGIDNYLIKPLSLQQLKRAIAKKT